MEQVIGRVATTVPPPKPPRLKVAAGQTRRATDVEPQVVAKRTDAQKLKKQLQFQSPLATRQPTNSEDAAVVNKNSSNIANTTTTTATAVRYASVEKVNAATTVTACAKSRRLVQGCNSLMYACQLGNFALVLEQLRSKPETLQQRDSHNKNALHYCAVQTSETGDLVAAASIAIAAPELLGSADEDGFTPLHLAVIQGNLAMVNLLLANKADVNAVDNEDHSVVHWATVCGEVEALRSVLSAGANVATPDINGGSPLHYAAQMCGANYEGKLGTANSAKLALEILGILLAHPQASVDVQDKDGRQPLLWAASAGSAKAVMALVKAGARVESADKDGLTALHCAASRGHTECIDTLISLCGAPTDLIDSNGCTALHYAVTLGHADATSRLLDLEADPNRQDRKGRTPAHCGCSKGQFETVKLLKERGANLWLRNAKGDLPVHEAACSGRRELVEWLLEQRPKQVNTTSNDGRTLLHIAAASEYTDMCKMLLDYGADINAVYRNGKGLVITPLDCALQKGNRSTAKFLQSNGGLPSSKLRLAARRANPFQEATTDAVRPLKYAEKEEIHDLHNSKKYVVYLKRSDSDGGDGGEAGDAEGGCSCTEETYKREQRYAHTCRRHQRSRKQLRRRTSSCGEAKQPIQSDEGGDISRSKSNIEIRRRKSREHHASSSEWEDGEEEEDSCENCCYHRRQKQRVLRRRSISSRRSRETKGSDQEDNVEPSPEKRKKQALNSVPKSERSVELALKEVGEKDNNAENTSRCRPRSATKRSTPPPAKAGKEGTFVKSPTHATNADLTDEEGQANKGAEVVTTLVDVHREADNSSLQLGTDGEDKAKENEGDVDGDKPIEKSVTEQVSKQVDQLLQIAATAVNSESKSMEESVGEMKDSSRQIVGEKVVEDSKLKVKGQPPSVVETPATPIPSPIPTPLPSPVTAPASTEDIAPPMADNASAPTASGVTPQGVTETSVGTISAADPSKEQPSTETPNVPPIPISEETASAVKEKEVAEQQQRDQESRRSFTLLPSDSAEEEEPEPVGRKSSFQVLKSDESVGDLQSALNRADMEFTDSQVFKIVSQTRHGDKSQSDGDFSSPEGRGNADYEAYEDEDEANTAGTASGSPVKKYRGGGAAGVPSDGTTGVFDYGSNGRKRRLKKRVKSGSAKGRSNWKGTPGGTTSGEAGGITKDQDSGFEPSPRAMKSKIPAPRNIYTAHGAPRRPNYAATIDGRSCSSRLENRKPGDKRACDMSAVTRSIQRNIRRYYMERKIFQHLLELKSLQIRSNKLNEAVLVKRAVDDYHKSCTSLGSETGTRLRRYTFSEYTFKNFELFLYETLKSLQKPGTYNFQNINEVYEEAERRLSPDYNAYEKALQCTNKTHRCLHAAHAYTGIPCAAYIPMMNHHTMPKFGFGPYKKTGVGSFYLPKILTSGGDSGGSRVALELSHGKSKQLISLPSDKLDSNKRYYVTFTVKEPGGGGGVSGDGTDASPGQATMDKQQNDANCGGGANAMPGVTMEK